MAVRLGLADRRRKAVRRTANWPASPTKGRTGLSVNKYRVQKLALNKYIANRRATAILALCHNDETADGPSHVFSGSNTRRSTQHTAYRALSVGSSADTSKAFGSVAGTRYFSAWVLHEVSVVDNPANKDCRFAILRGHWMPQSWLAPVRLGLGAGERGVPPTSFTLFGRYRPNPHHPGGGI